MANHQWNWKREEAPPRFGQLPGSRGLVFVCSFCSRKRAATRAALLKAWGERGIVAEVSAKLRCPNCRKRGMRAYLAPNWAEKEAPAPTPLDKLVAVIRAFVASGRID